jgi:hypothetical protein
MAKPAAPPNDSGLSAEPLGRVVLIGTSHKYQVPEHPSAQNFRALVEATVSRWRVRAIAEETSLEALAQKNTDRSVCEKIADELGLPHRYCDLNNAERAAKEARDELDIRAEGFLQSWTQERIEKEVRASRRIRERHWLQMLLDLGRWPVLFICGANHVASFRALLTSSGLSTKVAERDWSPAALP